MIGREVVGRSVDWARTQGREAIGKSADFARDHTKSLTITTSVALLLGTAAVGVDHRQDVADAFNSSWSALNAPDTTNTTSFPNVDQIFRGTNEDGVSFGIKREYQDIFGVDLPDLVDSIDQIESGWGCTIDTTITRAQEFGAHTDAQDDVFIVVDSCNTEPENAPSSSPESQIPEVGDVFHVSRDGSQIGIKRQQNDTFGVDYPDLPGALHEINSEWGCDINSTVSYSDASVQSGAQDDFLIFVNACDAPATPPIS